MSACVADPRAGRVRPPCHPPPASLRPVSASAIKFRGEYVLPTPDNQTAPIPNAGVTYPATGHADYRGGLPGVRGRVVAASRAVMRPVRLPASPHEHLGAIPDANVAVACQGPAERSHGLPRIGGRVESRS